METVKKIRLVDCDPDLRMKLEGLIRIYNGETAGEISNTALQELIDSVNKDLDNLKTNKIDKSQIIQYFNKETDKIDKNQLNNELADIINKIDIDSFRLKNDKITYSELAQDTTDKIEGIETRLKNLNDYILTNGAEGSIDTESQKLITELTTTVQANKEEEDTKITANANDITELKTSVSDVIDTITNLDSTYKKVGTQVDMSELPNDVQTVATNLKDSIAYSQDDKDLLKKLQELSNTTSIPFVYGYWGFDEASLDFYVEKLYEPIYYEIECTSGNSYLVKYTLVPDGSTADKALNNRSSIEDATDRTEVTNAAPGYDTYNTTVLSSAEYTEIYASFIYGRKNKGLILHNQLVAQRAADIISEEITIEANSYKDYDMYEYVETLYPLDIKVWVKDENNRFVNATHLVSIGLGTVPTTNSKGEATEHIGFRIENKTDEDLNLYVFVRGNLA